MMLHKEREKYGRYELSVQDGPNHYANPGKSAEIAIFYDGEWTRPAKISGLGHFDKLFENSDHPIAAYVALEFVDEIRRHLIALSEQES